MIPSFLLILLYVLTPKPETVHDFHVSYGRMVVEDNSAYLNIRMFTDDLEDGLRLFSDTPEFKLDASKKTDSLFTNYFKKKFIIKHHGRTLQPHILQSGEQEDMWWYTLSFSSTSPIQDIEVQYTLLFDLFKDQRNIFKILSLSNQKQQTLYYTSGAEKYRITL